MLDRGSNGYGAPLVVVLGISLIGLGGCGTSNGRGGGSEDQPDAINAEYLPHAQAAREQVATGKLPQVVERAGNVVTLRVSEDQTAGWNPSQVIVTQDADQSVKYQIVLKSVPLGNGQVAAITRDVDPLAAVSGAEVSIKRKVNLTGGTAANAKRAATRKLVDIFDVTYDDTVDLFDISGTELYADPNGRFSVEIVEGYLHFYPDVEIELTIDSPNQGVFDLLGDLLNDLTSAIEDLQGQLADAGVLDDEDIDTFEELLTLAEAADQANDVGSALAALADALVDPRRITLARARLDGALVGRCRLVAQASDAWYWEEELDLSDLPPLHSVLPVRVPISGPLPIFLTLNLLFNLDMGLDGRVEVTTGFDFETSVEAEARIANGELRTPTATISSPEFNEYGPFIEAELGFSAHAGVVPQVGVSLAEILKLTVDPELYLNFDALAQGAGSQEGSCVTLDWELNSPW